MITFQNWCKWLATLFLLLLSVFNCSAADWLCFTAEEAGSTIWFENEGDNNPNMQYSLDGDSWYDWNDNVKNSFFKVVFFYNCFKISFCNLFIT